MTPVPSSRVEQIESFKVMDLLKRAAELDAAGFDVVHMEAGEPDFPTAEPICRAAIRAIEQGSIKYTPAAGIPPLREKIAQWYQRCYGLSITPGRILITTGGSSGLLMLFALLTDAGQRFMMADPGYPCNRQLLRLLNAAPQLVAVDAEQNYQLNAELVQQHWSENTAGVLLASPANPTGSVIAPDELSALSQVVKGLGGSLVVDEIYHGLSYEAPSYSVLQNDDTAYVVNSFSKYFGMTGWRLGWVVAPENMMPALEKLAQNLMISPPTVSQYAALAAFDDDTIAIMEQRKAAFRARRDRLVEGLKTLGFEVPLQPAGAFYVYADASHLTDDSFAFCWQLLEEEHIACTPGLDFGNYRSNAFVRFSYTTGLDRIDLALTRMQRRWS
ncbi:pyridoxal phosphate-dependent aminotransferase [Pontibacter sp. JAM-7]|uniref:pyridoxal phosphate-dependent aminotransferase n=1 Tax=Pontibacter sp. JAM-7 TaxID=3366581 RepID=UPI003AF53AD5